MAVIMESNIMTIIFVNAGSGDNRTSQITPNIFCDSFRITFVRFGINIEAFFMFTVTFRFDFFKRRTNPVFKKIKKGCPESITQIRIIKVCFSPSFTGVSDIAVGNKTMDVGIPFEVSAKSVKDAYKTGSKLFRFIIFMEHMQNHIRDGFKKAAEEGAVFQKKVAEPGINDKNTVAVFGIDNLKGNGSSAVNGIFITAGRAEMAFAAERHKFKSATERTAVHGTAKSRITTIEHFVYVFNNRFTWM